MLLADKENSIGACSLVSLSYVKYLGLVKQSIFSIWDLPYNRIETSGHRVLQKYGILLVGEEDERRLDIGLPLTF